MTTRILKDGLNAFMPAFQGLDNTLAVKHLNMSEFAKHLDISELPPSLLVTSDFTRTIKVPKLLLLTSYR